MTYDRKQNRAWMRALRKLDQQGREAAWDLAFTYFIYRNIRRLQLPVSRDTAETRAHYCDEINTVVRSFVKAGWVISGWEFRRMIRIIAEEIEREENRRGPRKREDAARRDFGLSAGR